MTVRELYKVSPQNHLFIRTKDGVKQYKAYDENSDEEINRIFSVNDYPMFSNVIEIELKVNQEQKVEE